MIDRILLIGFARLFRPTYAGANMGHPSHSQGDSLSPPRDAAQDFVLGHFQPSLRDWSSFHMLPGIPPDFLYAALDASAYAAFFTESRVRLIDSNQLNRKSGSILGYFQPSLRD
jgi:hypothetical protein